MIENIARKAKAGLTGAVSPASPDIDQDQRGAALVKNLATGGLALGAGASAGVMLLNYLKSIREENELEDESRMNDDTLYIPATTKSAADGGVNRWLAPGLGATAGILGAAGSFAVTQQIYSHLQKKRRQRLLDEAQGEALAAADEEAEKYAAEAQMDFYDLATAFPVAVPLLAAMAAGGVSYAALNKTFPTVKSPKSKYPKRIRQVAAPAPEEGEDEQQKAASLYAEDDLEDAANEFLMLTVDQMATEKNASICLTSDIINRVAKDGLTGLSVTQRDGGLESVVEAVKGASEERASLDAKAMAAAAICKCARLRPIVTHLAAAEFVDLAPGIFDSVTRMGEDHMDKMAGIAPLMQLRYFRPLMLSKEAMQSPLVGELGNLADFSELTQDPAAQFPNELVDPAEMDDALTSDAAGGMGEEAEGIEDGEEALAGGSYENRQDEDPVDQMLASQGEVSPILDPIEETEEEAAATAPSFPG